ncbi:bifunctional diguanylate cyclase/phosphodiesterase [Azospirillum sp. TSO22-1]|uniref:putative bifunctional diguanylate cyclase/phosphodiesterase n=1 Tax=Azospirillum sp. TSO22-1 TaxID=716789 RepID=UPI000D619B79|nr:bifunctional diguanylate cyclase/phosphodiesterase [Azospirillum sp. TSO22-1]PWC55543.1 diguanylate cyclase [Azospirillum sp. TSO22-1]
MAGLPRGTEFLASLAASLLDHSAFPLVYVGADGSCYHVAPGFAALLDATPKALIGRHLSEFDHPVARSVAVALAGVAATGVAAPVDCVATRGDGRRLMLTGCVIPHQGPDGGAPGFLGVLHDIADEERIADFVMRRDPFVATLLDAAVDGIVITDRRGAIRSINRACCQQFGYEEAELLGQNVTALMPPPFSRDHDRFIQTYLQTDRAKIIGIGRESLGRRKDGTVFPIHLSVGQARLGEEITFVAMIRDISDRLAAEQRASYLARHDALTGVLTRTAFLEECEAVLARGSVDGGGDTTPCFALYSLDVDQFSDINEAFGFHVGDAALKALVSRVIEVLPKETYICRIAADEFAALSRVDDLDQARTLADVLHDRLTASIYADRHWVRLRVSIGAAVFDPSVQRVEELNAKAKLALQSVQHNGGNAVCFYTPEMAAAATRRMLLTMHLAHAIERNELHLVYQPIVEAKTGEVTSAEALLRWTHHTLGAISPGEFIPVAEESGLIVPITDWVLATVVRQMAEWDSRGVLPKRVFLNISGQQFLRGNLTHRLVELLEDQPHLRGHLGLEITEQAAVRDLKVAVRTLSDLADIGVQVAIDDFGSGYSSLSYVQQLPVAKLKIDRAFIVDVPENSRNAALVRAAVGMAHGLGLVTVAEGVETVEQQEFLASTGCDQLQGYLFGRPMMPDALAEMVREQRAAKAAR